MAEDLLNFYPFNIRSGPGFLFLYAVLSAVGLLVLVLIRRTYGGYLDGVFAARAQKGFSGKLLRIGELPSPPQYYAIAYLERGEHGVADTLIAVAHAAGCLKANPENPKTYLISGTASAPAHPILRAFLERLKPKSGTAPEAQEPLEATANEVRNAAVATATEFRTQILLELQASGMVREAEVQSRVVSAIWMGGTLLLAFGGIRLARALLLGHRVLFLAIGMVILAIWISVIASNHIRESVIKTAYMKWLRDSTVSLLDGVESGFHTGADSIGLGVALGGVTILGAAVVGTGLVYAFNPNYSPRTSVLPAASGGSSDGGSSCGGGGGGSDSGGSSSCSGGSSSCSSGSGGGCGGGGGGCGGGGGGCGGGGCGGGS